MWAVRLCDCVLQESAAKKQQVGPEKKSYFKAARVDVFTSLVDEIAVYNVDGVS